MARGRLEAPDLDDRTWEEIVAQARALIPTYAPNWTDHNPSDLGITLIELFAWLVEGMIFRLNRVPDKNLIEFLNLIGITRDPPTPASTYLTYRLAPAADALLVPRGHQASTPQTEEKDAVVFEVDQELRVLRVNLTTALLLFADPGAPDRFVYRNVTNRVVASPLGGLTLMIPASDSVMLALGFDAASTEPIALRARLSKPVRRLEAQITWHHSRGNLPPLPDSDRDWTDLSVAGLEDGTDGFQKNAIVRFSVPPPWDSQNPADWNVRPVPGEAAVDESRCWARRSDPQPDDTTVGPRDRAPAVQRRARHQRVDRRRAGTPRHEQRQAVPVLRAAQPPAVQGAGIAASVRSPATADPRAAGGGRVRSLGGLAARG